MLGIGPSVQAWMKTMENYPDSEMTVDWPDGMAFQSTFMFFPFMAFSLGAGLQVIAIAFVH